MSRRHRSRGQAIVEFALIFPVFLLVTLGVVDMARMFTSYVALTNGVREAAIFAAEGSSGKWWCTDVSGMAASPAVSVACPAGTPVGNRQPDPDNMAYRIAIETSVAIDNAQVILATPVCTNAVGTAVACGSAAVTRVTVTASHTFKLLTPVLSTILGAGIPMTVTITAGVY
jgi:Flp pilus assembly protein TadG